MKRDVAENETFIQQFQQLAELHTARKLSDEEFAAAKTMVFAKGQHERQ